MTKKLRLSLAIALCLTAVCIAWPQPARDPLDSLVVCASTQHLILENAFVRVIDDSIPAGASEPRTTTRTASWSISPITHSSRPPTTARPF